MIRNAGTVVRMQKRRRTHVGDPGDPEAIAPQQVMEIAKRRFHDLRVRLQAVGDQQ